MLVNTPEYFRMSIYKYLKDIISGDSEGCSALYLEGHSKENSLVWLSIMELLHYLNSIYDSDRLDDYKFRKIDPESADLSDSDKEILELILDVIRLKENYKQKENVFEQLSRTRLPELKKITKEDLVPLFSISIVDLPLPICARIADFLWTTIYDPKTARIAIRSYLELYEKLWDVDHWPNCIDAIFRATNIACCLDKKGQEYKECIETVIKGLDRTQGNDSLFLSSSLLELLAGKKYKMTMKIQQYARNVVETAKRDNNLQKAQSVLETLIKLDPQNKNLYYEEAGDITQSLAFAPAIRCVHTLNQALQYYQKAGAREKQHQCRKRLEEAQSHILQEMQMITTTPVDISSTVKEVCTGIRKTANIKQAILAFSDYVFIYRCEKLLKDVQKESIIAGLFPSTKVDCRGRQIYSLPPLPLKEELDINDQIVQSHMWEKAKKLQELNAGIVLKYAISELNRLYQYSEEDIDFLVNENALIPEGREKIIRKGIFIGLQGDLYIALHILIPQFESILRFLVEMCGGNTFYIESNGDVKDYVLGQLLENEELNESFDPDIIFLLKGLLDKKEGSNLRNVIAHGFMEPSNSPIELYFFGFIIKFLSWYNVACWEERQKMKDERKE